MEYKVEGLKHKLLESKTCRQCLYCINSPTHSEEFNFQFFCSIYDQPLSTVMMKPPWCAFKGFVGVFENRVKVEPDAPNEPVPTKPKKLKSKKKEK